MSVIKKLAKLTFEQDKIFFFYRFEKSFIDYLLPHGSRVNVAKVLIGLLDINSYILEKVVYTHYLNIFTIFINFSLKKL